MAESKETPSSVVVPDGFPVEVMKALQRSLKPQAQRSLAFQNRNQRNTAFIQKGLTKPGKISYDTLRRASLSVHVVRICIQTLKQKVTKTKWVIQNKDIQKRRDASADKRIEEVGELFKHPNQNNDTFRTLLDKMVEDLLVLDAVSIEKTRFPDGKLAELFFVDSATIRPVYDEHGNQDVTIPLKVKDGETRTDLPVSYVQVLNNSQYGGPESGDIIAAWPKRDFLYFHMNPQGDMEGYGYGLSPIESILSVVANILNADNYNSTYFEEGAFPPIIMQLIGQVNQRDLEAYREYMVAELQGNFHRPAIMATEKAESLQIHNLKDMNNRDMQFMEYQSWLAKLACAIYGLSPEDIGLTDTTGSKSVSEVQKDISDTKGYSSILNLLKEVFNQEIIWKDFGYKDLEFEWVAPDTVEPGEASEMYDRDLRNGTITINEVRQKRGESPYGEWADEPMILTANGYQPLDPIAIKKQKDEDAKKMAQQDGQMGKGDVGNEKPYHDQDVDGAETVEKGAKRTLYVSKPLKNADELIAWAKSQGFKTTLPAEEMHVTVVYSKKPVDWSTIGEGKPDVSVIGGKRWLERLGDEGAVVLRFESPDLQGRHGALRDAGASSDYVGYRPHVTISYNAEGLDISKIEPFDGPLMFGAEYVAEINSGWHEKIVEKSMRKSILTTGGYKVWMDDRGYSQPFIWSDIKTGYGRVVKPPVAVNLQSQELEISLTDGLAAMGLNVNRVFKETFIEVMDGLRSLPEVLMEFERYCNMTPEYDSEKWRAKHGGSRKFSYYLVSDYIEGYALSNRLLIADMERDPNSYKLAVRDLARLWKAERDLVLGDRRADQYIISPNKRAWGIDYQFQGDVPRWEKTQNAIRDQLAAIPQLLAVFEEEIAEKEGIVKRIIKRYIPGL